MSKQFFEKMKNKYDISMIYDNRLFHKCGLNSSVFTVLLIHTLLIISWGLFLGYFMGPVGFEPATWRIKV